MNPFSKPNTPASVYMIVLNWNGKHDTLECLDSIDDACYEDKHVIVVDNGSNDDSVEAIRNRWPNITVIETGDNLGYAQGNNVGIEQALNQGADYILVLNNDTIIAPDMLDELVTAASTDDHGIFGPLSYYHDNPKLIWWAGTVWLPDKSSFTHRGCGEIDNGNKYDQLSECDYVVGSALFAPSQAYRDIGLLDPRYFLTFEETEWCYRARLHGYHCYCAPKAKLWHKVASSMGSDSPLQNYFFMRNALLWGERYLDKLPYLKLLGSSVSQTLRPSMNNNPSTGLIKRIYWSIYGLFNKVTGRKAHPISRAKYLGLRDYLLRNFGNCPDEIREISKNYTITSDKLIDREYPPA